MFYFFWLKHVQNCLSFLAQNRVMTWRAKVVTSTLHVCFCAVRRTTTCWKTSSCLTSFRCASTAGSCSSKTSRATRSAYGLTMAISAKWPRSAARQSCTPQKRSKRRCVCCYSLRASWQTDIFSFLVTCFILPSLGFLWGILAELSPTNGLHSSDRGTESRTPVNCYFKQLWPQAFGCDWTYKFFKNRPSLLKSLLQKQKGNKNVRCAACPLGHAIYVCKTSLSNQTLPVRCTDNRDWLFWNHVHLRPGPVFWIWSPKWLRCASWPALWLAIHFGLVICAIILSNVISDKTSLQL